MSVGENATDTQGAVGFASGRALIVAIAAYPLVNPLPSVVLKDGRDIAAALISPHLCGFDPTKVELLLDDAATKTNILDRLQLIATNALPTDTIWFYFSGHGALMEGPLAGTSGLVPFNCDPDNFLDTVITEDELSTVLAAIRAERVLVILDACHAGGAGTLKAHGLEAKWGVTEKTLARLASGKGRVLIASSRVSETSLILPGAQNSAFTEQLLHGLVGAAKRDTEDVIRVFGLFDYVATQVSHATSDQQHPIFKATEVENDFPVALAAGGVKNSTSLVADIGEGPGELHVVLASLYPMGPADEQIWARAGGDYSRLHLAGSGNATWFSAIRALRQGGGGGRISEKSLIAAALSDFPGNPQLRALAGKT